MKRVIPGQTVQRLSFYLRTLRYLHREGVRVISSERLTKHLNVTATQVRKDLSYFGPFGRPGVGYNVSNLIKKVESILGLDQKRKVILVGVGKLGSALLAYPGFRRYFRFVAVFDKNPEKIGKVYQKTRVRDVADMEWVIKKEKVRLGIIAVPTSSAQEIASRMTNGGIKGILNFAPLYLNIGEDIQIRTVDMAIEMENIVYYLKDLTC